MRVFVPILLAVLAAGCSAGPQSGGSAAQLTPAARAHLLAVKSCQQMQLAANTADGVIRGQLADQAVKDSSAAARLELRWTGLYSAETTYATSSDPSQVAAYDAATQTIDGDCLQLGVDTNPHSAANQ